MIFSTLNKTKTNKDRGLKFEMGITCGLKITLLQELTPSVSCLERYSYSVFTERDIIYVTCSAIWGLLDKDDDLRASHGLLNTERIVDIPNMC